jgi:integrase/recombinase XerD
MTQLRQRMIEDRQRRGLSARTQEMSVRAVHQLAEHDHKPPDRITEVELRDYCLSLKNVKHYSRSARTIALCGITFFYTHTLQREWTTLTFVRPPREQKLPVILGPTAVRTILACVRLPRDRVCLSTIYACGLRLQEGTHLQVDAIDSARMCLHVRLGTGGTDRYVPLPHRILARLRQYWGTPRHPVWIFPAPGRGGMGMATAVKPMPRSRVPDAFRTALHESGLRKRACIHTLRHSWATPRLEAGVNRHLIQASLGHHSPATTALYTPLTLQAQELAGVAINRLMEDR